MTLHWQQPTSKLTTQICKPEYNIAKINKAKQLCKINKHMQPIPGQSFISVPSENVGKIIFSEVIKIKHWPEMG